MNAARTSRADQVGVVRGCCLGLVLLAAIAIFAAVQGFRALADPNLGAPPAGTSHGTGLALIAAELAGDAGTQLVAGEHAVVVLSEQDLTVIATARNPSPDRFRNPQVRVRDGLLVMSAQSSVGPFGVTPVARTQVVFSDPSGSPQIAAQAVDFAVGQLTLPQWLGERLDPAASTTINFAKLFAANPILLTLSQALECVSVKPDGVHVGFHRPGAATDSSRCG
ncbi:MAG TPA: hypothetical protein VIG86_03220 [Candidatus Dormibacteraeota bacterium]|jgi:hypothetical protein